MRMLMVAVGVVGLMASASAQDKAVTASPANSQKAPELPRELALEVELQQTKEALTQTRNDLTALRVQFNGLSKVLDEFLAAEANPRIQSVLDSRKAIEAKAIKALGGDPDKGDTFDWATKRLMRKDDKK